MHELTHTCTAQCEGNYNYLLASVGECSSLSLSFSLSSFRSCVFRLWVPSFVFSFVVLFFCFLSSHSSVFPSAFYRLFSCKDNLYLPQALIFMWRYNLRFYVLVGLGHRQSCHCWTVGGGFLHALMACYGSEGHRKELRSW